MPNGIVQTSLSFRFNVQNCQLISRWIWSMLIESQAVFFSWNVNINMFHGFCRFVFVFFHRLRSLMCSSSLLCSSFIFVIIIVRVSCVSRNFYLILYFVLIAPHHIRFERMLFPLCIMRIAQTFETLVIKLMHIFLYKSYVYDYSWFSIACTLSSVPFLYLAHAVRSRFLFIAYFRL